MIEGTNMQTIREGYWAFSIGMKPVLDSTSSIEEIKTRLQHIGKPDAIIYKHTIIQDGDGVISNVFTQVIDS